MAEISAKDVMALRTRTGLGMMDCKKALTETDGDVAQAEENLRKKLKGKMDARTERAAGEGRIAIASSDDGRAAAIIELRAETDFTARNEAFLDAAEQIARMALEASSGQITDPTGDMTSLIDNLRITTGENVSFARGHKLSGDGNGAFGVYLHHDGKTGVLVQGEGDVSEDTLRDVAMHCAAVTPRPLGVTKDDIPANQVEKERKFALEQAMESGKPQEIAEKMVEGKMRKFYEEVALTEQPFVKDPDRKVRDLLKGDASIVAFERWTLGESGEG